MNKPSELVHIKIFDLMTKIAELIATKKKKRKNYKSTTRMLSSSYLIGAEKILLYQTE